MITQESARKKRQPQKSHTFFNVCKSQGLHTWEKKVGKNHAVDYCVVDRLKEGDKKTFTNTSVNILKKVGDLGFNV